MTDKLPIEELELEQANRDWREVDALDMSSFLIGACGSNEPVRRYWKHFDLAGRLLKAAVLLLRERDSLAAQLATIRAENEAFDIVRPLLESLWDEGGSCDCDDHACRLGRAAFNEIRRALDIAEAHGGAAVTRSLQHAESK